MDEDDKLRKQLSRDHKVEVEEIKAGIMTTKIDLDKALANSARWTDDRFMRTSC